MGKIKIDSLNTSGVYKLNILNKYKSISCELIGTPSIELDDGHLGNYNNCVNAGAKIENVEFLYQLLTDKGYFYVNGLKIKDYNYGIDKYIVQ